METVFIEAVLLPSGEIVRHGKTIEKATQYTIITDIQSYRPPTTMKIIK